MLRLLCAPDAPFLRSASQLEEAEDRDEAEPGAGGIDILEGDAAQAPPDEGAPRSRLAPRSPRLLSARESRADASYSRLVLFCYGL